MAPRWWEVDSCPKLDRCLPYKAESEEGVCMCVCLWSVITPCTHIEYRIRANRMNQRIEQLAFHPSSSYPPIVMFHNQMVNSGLIRHWYAMRTHILHIRAARPYKQGEEPFLTVRNEFGRSRCGRNSRKYCSAKRVGWFVYFAGFEEESLIKSSIRSIEVQFGRSFLNHENATSWCENEKRVSQIEGT